jgi:cysteinyl-tRNA synthetase
VTLRLYDTLERRKVDFVPRDEGRVSMYVCGPTVYNHIHIGNARTFLSFDVIRRYLEYRSFDVSFVRNITDVDDKIIAAAAEEGVDADEIAERYTVAFHEAMEALGMEPPTAEPRATQTISEMIDMTESLIASGHAYEAGGDVYFSVRSFPGYGKLSRRDVDELRSGARVEVDERKRDPLDFALWKAAKPGEPHWSSPWGEGRPGWHLECSVMSVDHLGESFDIHGGAQDLIFPHHENEIAQSEAATGTPFARHWLHAGLLQVDAEKMSKSLGNFMLLKDVLVDYPAPVVRLLMLQTHYRSPLDFSLERLDEAATAYDRLATPLRNLAWLEGHAAGEEEPLAETLASVRDGEEEARRRFVEEMDDDFNTAGALGAVFDLVRELNRFLESGAAETAAGREAARVAADTVTELAGVLGIEVTGAVAADYPDEVVGIAREFAGYAGDAPAEAVEALLVVRAKARAEQDWDTSDAVRDRLAAAGLTIEDTKDGPRVVLESSR